MSTITRGTVKIITVRFLESDIWEGSIPHECYDSARIETRGDVSASEVVDIIRGHGLTFLATGGSWAANPDGSYISDYGTGERTETSAHLDGWPQRVEAAIVDAVDAS